MGPKIKRWSAAKKMSLSQLLQIRHSKIPSGFIEKDGKSRHFLGALRKEGFASKNIPLIVQKPTFEL